MATAREDVKQMSAMIVVAFRDEYRAAEVLVEPKSLMVQGSFQGIRRRTIRSRIPGGTFWMDRTTTTLKKRQLTK